MTYAAGEAMTQVLTREAIGPSHGPYERREAKPTGILVRLLAARDVPFAFLTVLWLGALIGVSFLATPVKFQAPSLNLATALEVGRVTFALFSRIEWGLCALLALSIAIGTSRPWRWIGCLLLAALLVAQTAWLLPVLDARVGAIIAGAEPMASFHHILYIATEAAKALLLLVLSVTALVRLAEHGGRG